MTPDPRAHIPEEVVDLDDVQHYSDTSRIKSLSDGVFSIAMTLLAFTLIEQLPRTPYTFSAFLDAFGGKLVVYAITFVVLGVYWISHAIQFHYVVRADRPLMVRTVLFLVFVSLVPFTASFLGEFRADRLAISLYATNLAACGIALAGMLLYATRDPLMLHAVMDRRIFRALRAAYLAGPILYVLAIVVSFASPTAGFVICIAVPAVTFFPNPFWGRFYARLIGNRGAAEEEEAHDAAASADR
ncbi:MAG: TMEM175 family protein [Thermoplasmatota archaeon]